MFTRLAAPAVLVLLGAVATGCGALSGDGQSGEQRVVAAFYPLAWVSERVAGDHLDVENLTSPGGEPHDLELSVRETAQVEDAALLVYQDGFQAAVDAAVEQNAGGEVLDVTDVVELRPFAEHDHEGEEHGDEHAEEEHAEEEHSADDGHDHGDLDPHFWLDPLLLADVADAVADRLSDLDPDHADDFAANAAELREELTALDTTYDEGLATCERDLVVVNHDAFGYLARYGLHLEPIVGLSPEAEPTPADLARLQDLVKDEGLTTVFAESLVSPKTAETLAGDVGVEVGVLDPIEGLSDRTADEDYLSLMESNLTELREANGCR